jgi:hypothetical protein
MQVWMPLQAASKATRMCTGSLLIDLSYLNMLKDILISFLVLVGARCNASRREVAKILLICLTSGLEIIMSDHS